MDKTAGAVFGLRSRPAGIGHLDESNHRPSRRPPISCRREAEKYSGIFGIFGRQGFLRSKNQK